MLNVVMLSVVMPNVAATLFLLFSNI
jgi:hypothetical protein